MISICCIHAIMAKIATKFNLAAPNFKKISGRACPQTPLETGMLRMPCSYYSQF